MVSFCRYLEALNAASNNVDPAKFVVDQVSTANYSSKNLVKH